MKTSIRVLACVLSLLCLPVAAHVQTIKPAAPGLRITVRRTAASVVPSVALTWVASVPAVNPIAGYNVLRAAVTGGPYTQVNTALIASTSFTDSTVVVGSTYFYVADAVDTKGSTSGYSNEVSITVSSGPIYTQSIQSGATSLSFSYVLGATAPASQAVAVISTPSTALPVTVTCDQPWLVCTDDSATTKVNVTVAVSITGLAVGTYNGNVVSTNTDGTAINTPFKLPVKLVVTSNVPTMLGVPVLTTTHTSPTKDKVTATYSDAPANFTSYTFFGTSNVLQQSFPARASNGKYQISWTGTPQNGMFSVCDSVGACESVPFTK